MTDAFYTTEDKASYVDDDDDAELVLLHESPDDWVVNLLKKSVLVQPNSQEQGLINLLIDRSIQAAQLGVVSETGLALAASFDLFVAVEYYARLTNTGWLYCPADPQLLIYHFTNTCPRCILANEFYFHQARKPGSGTIGGITRRLLCLFLACLFERNNSNLKVYTAPEPVDILVYDEKDAIVLLAEAKAAPLTTLPLVLSTEKQTHVDTRGNLAPRPHEDAENSLITTSRLQLMLPQPEKSGWSYELLSLNARGTQPPSSWAYEQVKRLFGEDELLFTRYLTFWDRAYKAYNKAERVKGEPVDPIYWLTNACGTPKPRPIDWPKRRTGSGNGYESVSDGKSSVGIDRTDDIKKGIYQVLKIATAAKPKSSYKIKTALLSNIHAVRHYNEYLSDLQDVVWTQDKTGRAKKAKDLPDDQRIYNLFDGIISFTRNHPRDEWIESNFRF